MITLTCLLCGFFIDGGISAHHSYDPRPGRYFYYDINRTRNPYGILAAGYQFPKFKQFETSLQLRHESAIEAHDHGTDSLQLTIRWTPWSQK
jgi:2-hydroxychromene-2-carboxylate isomerase